MPAGRPKNSSPLEPCPVCEKGTQDVLKHVAGSATTGRDRPHMEHLIHLLSQTLNLTPITSAPAIVGTGANPEDIWQLGKENTVSEPCTECRFKELEIRGLEKNLEAQTRNAHSLSVGHLRDCPECKTAIHPRDLQLVQGALGGVTDRWVLDTALERGLIPAQIQLEVTA